MSVSVSVCLSVTSRCSVETDERIELALVMGASFRLFYTVLKGSLRTSTSKGTSLWNFVPNAGLRKVCFGIWSSKHLIDLAPQGGPPIECDKLDYRRSTKLTIPPSSDNRSLFYHNDQWALSASPFCRAGLLATVDSWYFYVYAANLNVIHFCVWYTENKTNTMPWFTTIAEWQIFILLLGIFWFSCAILTC